jgi:drug/metabolite transporter, DME family
MVRSEARRGYLFVLLAAALWALITPGMRFLLQQGVGAFEIAFWRCILAWLLFAGHLLTTRTAPRIVIRDVPRVVGLGLLGVAALYVTLPLAVEAGGAALASILLYTAPAWVAILSWPMLGERPSEAKVLALLLTILGVMAFAVGGPGGARVSAPALAWGLTAGVCYASLYLFGKVLFARYSPPQVFFYALPLAAILLLPATEFSASGPATWAVIGLVGTVSTYGAYTAYAAGLTRLEATRASIVATVEPVLAGLVAYLIWRERFSVVGYLGGALIIGAVLLVALEGGRRRR